MASAERIDVEKCEDFVTLEELEGGNVPWIVELARSHLDGAIVVLLPLIILQKMHAAIMELIP